MKKGLFILLILSLLFCAALVLAEENLLCGTFEYALLEDGDAELIEYYGIIEDVIIPNTLDGHPITAVRGNPFYDQSSGRVKDCKVSVSVDHPYLATINGVLFGQSDRKLISYFPSLPEEYTIPQGVYEIGANAFSGCYSLISVSIPDSVTTIGDGAFKDCIFLTSVSIPNSIVNIGNYAFFNCSGLTSVTIPNSITSISNYAFSSCSGLVSISIPNSVTSIGMSAFADCTGLTSVIIPDSVTSIGDGAFGECTSLTYVSIPDSVTCIEDYAFYRCYSLTSVTIPDSVTSIGDNAFSQWLFNSPLPDIILTVTPGSYAESYCIQNGIAYTYPEIIYGDNDSWLNP